MQHDPTRRTRPFSEMPEKLLLDSQLSERNPVASREHFLIFSEVIKDGS